MKILLYISLALSLFFTSLLSAQDFKGIATYKSQRKMDIQMDSTQMNDEMHQQMMAMLKKQFEKEYTLDFNKNESLYKEAENLAAPTGNTSGMQIVIAGSGEGDILYKNLTENRYATQSDVFGKIFLINDTLEQPEWKLEKETKNIGEYTCFKATFKRKVMMSSSMTMSVNSKEEPKEPEQKEVEQTVTAWYTLQIPVKHGPGNYSGLPGLILEVSDGSETILCSRIIINPKGGVSIEEPKKGKKVNQKEFETILEKKMKEMDEQFNSGRRDDGHSIEIRIGG
ncbi:MAG: GLPGLI family protein [Flavobacterium sp.]|nr:MAG: GLPGLI family protein [Flavobacterium sp.]